MIKYNCAPIVPGMPSQLLELRQAELEALLNRHPNILDSAIIGLPDDKLEGNDLPCAYIMRERSFIDSRRGKTIRL